VNYADYNYVGISHALRGCYIFGRKFVPANVDEFPNIFKENTHSQTMEHNLSTPKLTWAQGNTDDIEDSGKNKVLLTAGEHACLLHVTTDFSWARRNVIKTNDCQTVQTDATLFYVKLEMTQAHRGTHAILTGSDGTNDWSAFHTGLLVFESWVSNSRPAATFVNYACIIQITL
jgi:hypothetical protein